MIDDLIQRLTEPTWSHDCWGRSEKYDPPEIQLEAAKVIKVLRDLLRGMNPDASILNAPPKENDEN